MSLTAVRRASFFLLSKNAHNKNSYNRPTTFALKSLSSQMFSTQTDKDEEKRSKAKANKEKVKAIGNSVKVMWKKYGMVFLGTHFAVYFSSWAAIFFSLDFDLLNTSMVGLDPAAAVTKVCDMIENYTGITSVPQYIRENPRMGTLAVSWVALKFTEPVRLALSVGLTPVIARAIGRAPAKHDDDDDEDEDDNDKADKKDAHKASASSELKQDTNK